MLIDSHCHLSFKSLGEYTQATTEILNQATKNQVKLVLDVVLKPNLLQPALVFSDAHSMVYNAYGIHPCDVTTAASIVTSNQLIDIFKSHDKLIGVGETGLDYYYSDSNKSFQIQSFENHCLAASAMDKPIIVHTRDAWDDTYNILKNMVNQRKLRGIIHCFTGGIEEAKKFIDLGFYISFSGIVTFKKSTALQDVAKYLLLENILIETDSPYLAPTPYRGKDNQPAFVYHIAKYIAQIKGIDFSQVAEVTSLNFIKLFNLNIG